MSHRKQGGCALRLAAIPALIVVLVLRAHRAKG